MIEFDRITKRYDETEVVSDVSLTVMPHTITVIVGTSGSGKTTLIRMVNRLVEPTSGTIRIDGEDNRSVPEFELRRRIGYSIQGHGLFPHRTVAENIATVPDAARLGEGADQGQDRTAADALPARSGPLRAALPA
ncbi:ABC-type proline/glycine betaine transport system ATPase subunit [Sinorhizobium fredii]